MFYLIPIVLLAAVAILFFSLIREGISLFIQSSGIKTGNYLSNGGTQIDLILRKNNFYKELSFSGKERFLFRTVNFMFDKDFVGMNGTEVTEEMKLLISASAVQLTWGLNEYKLNHYHTIRIYPDTFYSKMMDAHLKGGATKTGVIFLSWKDFLAGYATPDDKYNLGLHELAHALELDVLHGEYFDDHFGENLAQWTESAMPEFEKIRVGQTSFLRDYAGTNMREFFAVSIEHFFEVPAEFKKAMPELFNHLSFILQINPLNKANDFNFRTTGNFDAEKPLVQRLVRDFIPEKTDHGWLPYLFYFLSFVGVIFLFFVLPLVQRITFIPDWLSWIFILLFGTLNIVKYKKYRELKISGNLFFIVFSYLCVGVISTFIFLLINSAIHFDNMSSHKFVIQDKEASYSNDMTGGSSNDENILFTFENNTMATYHQIRRLRKNDFYYAWPGDTIEYTVASGLLGIPVITKTHLLKKSRE